MGITKLALGMAGMMAVAQAVSAGGVESGRAEPNGDGARVAQDPPPRQNRPGGRRQRLTRSFAIGEGQALDLRTISGDIEVVAGDTEQVTVQVAIRGRRADAETGGAPAVDLRIEERGGRVEVRAVSQDGGGGRPIPVSYEVLVPSGTPIVAKSVSGDVSVTNAQGEVHVETVSGNLSLVSVTRLALAKSVSGDVDLEAVGAEGELQVVNVEGAVRAQGVQSRSFTLTTVSGRARLSNMRVEQVNVRSVSGDIDYAGPLAPGGRYELQAHSGDIEIFVIGEASFELEARSASGQIRSPLPAGQPDAADAASDDDDDRGGARTLARVYGTGSALLTATTFSGDIEVGTR